MINGISSVSQYQINPLQNAGIRGVQAGNEGAGNSQANEAKGKSDVVEISDEARKMFASSGSSSGNSEENANGLTAEEQAEVDRLQAIDRRVRAHERAHVAAGGNLITKGASFEYETGPDGKRYAVAGEVSIDVSPEQDPEATIRKAQRVRAAAMAPADPSPQDRRVAAEAAAMAREASMEAMQEEEEQPSMGSEEVSGVSAKADTQQVSGGLEKTEQTGKGEEVSQEQAAADRVPAAQFGKNVMTSAAMAYQGAFHLTEPAFNRTVFA